MRSTAKGCVADLTSEMKRIDGVVQLIDELARQTNLLALNATIEATRAGEAGRDFAVVAGEVKDLAVRSGRAAAQVREQISAMQATAGQVSTVADVINSVIEDLNATAIADSMREQSSATTRIVAAVEKAHLKSLRLAQAGGSIRAAAAQTDACATSMRDASAELHARFAQLRTDAAAFVQRIAAK